MIEKEMSERKEHESYIPPHLREDASYLQCSKCGRKSYGGEQINAICIMPIDGIRCHGIMEGKTDEKEGK